jgi:hypothetical protein
VTTPIVPTDPPDLQTQYPHVDGISDWRAQQSIRLLWDRVFDHEARLQATEGTSATLVTAANDHQDQITLADHKADEALAASQMSTTEKAVIATGTTDSDLGLGDKGCGEAGSSGDITGTQTVETAGKIICGVGNEFPALLAPASNQIQRNNNRDQLLDRMIWHLNQAGIPAAHYPTPNGRPYILLLDALAADGSSPVRQYAYRVLDYAVDDYTKPYTTLMVYSGQTVGTTTTPDPGIPD